MDIRTDIDMKNNSIFNSNLEGGGGTWGGTGGSTAGAGGSGIVILRYKIS